MSGQGRARALLNSLWRREGDDARGHNWCHSRGLADGGDGSAVPTTVFAPGGYRYIPGVFQYSGGVAAEPGFAIERMAFREPVPLARGFERVAALIKARGRPLTAFCACELRSPAPFTDDGFRAFNEVYCRTLSEWGIYNAVTKAN